MTKEEEEDHVIIVKNGEDHNKVVKEIIQKNPQLAVMMRK